MNFGVAAYSFPCGCGLLSDDAGRAVAVPMDAFALADLAVREGLSGIETPLHRMLPDLSRTTVLRLRDTLRDAGLSLTVDAPVVEERLLRELIPLASLAGARVVRAMLSTILEGARASAPDGWEAYLAGMRRRIAALVPLLEAHDLVLAVENHQDATSAELVELCAACGPRVGVTLDVANPLAVGEEPLAFARAVGPLVRNVHLKDYRVALTPSGYRLVRCALGEGVIPIPGLLAELKGCAPEASLHIELAALYARHIRILEPEWWAGYPATDVRAVLPALGLVARAAEPPDRDGRTPWERGEPPDEVARWELAEFEASVRYMRSLSAGTALAMA